MSEPLPSHADHPGKSRRHLAGLDGIRGLAILLVMLSHFISVGGNLTPPPGLRETAWTRFLESGYLGVDLFFVLSGFLITGILIDAKSDPHYFRTFYIRRALRIFPLYYGVLAAAWLSVKFLTPQDAARLTGQDSLGWYWAYASNIGMACKGDWLNNPTWLILWHFWSLAVEEQFYLVWPLVVYLTPVKWLERICVVLIFTKPWIHPLLGPVIGSEAVYASTLTQLGTLAAGAWMAIAWRDPQRWLWLRKFFVPLAWASALLLLMERTWLGDAWWRAEGLLALLLGSSFVGLAASSHGFFTVRFLSSPVLRWLGKYSYGIYVYHHALKPVWVEFLWNRWIVPAAGTGWPATLWYTAAASAISFALAWLSWKFIEGPILSLKNRFEYQPRGA